MKRLEVLPTPETIADSIENDTAGRNEEIISLIRMLDAIEGPYSLLIDAPWGDGKTFFIRSVEEALKALNPGICGNASLEKKLSPVVGELGELKNNYLPFYFNAWEHDFAGDPTSALFAAMAVAFKKEGFERNRSWANIFEKVVEAAISISPLKVDVSGVIEAASGKSVIASYEEKAKLRSLVDKLVDECVEDQADKLVIIIDELDRCRPDFAVRLLEQTKSLFQNENVIVLISTDSLQLAHACAGLYGPSYDSQRFIERFYDRRLELGPIDPVKVVSGGSIRATSHQYDRMVDELVTAHRLTIRDYARIHDKLEAGRGYCDEDDFLPALITAKCLFVPLLIFIERDDSELFRAVVHGVDCDALYRYGSKYPLFLQLLGGNVNFAKRGQSWAGEADASEGDCRRYVRDICVWLFSIKRSGAEFYEACERLNVPGDVNRSPFITLSFPK